MLSSHYRSEREKERKKKVNDRRAILQVWKQVSKYDGYNGRSAILSLNLSGQKQGGKREGGANPLRFARRVFNFQGHQYVPRNPPAALLQSLCPFSLPSPFILLPLSFFLARVPRPTGFLLLLTLTTLPSSTCFIDAATAPCLRGCCNYIYHFDQPSKRLRRPTERYVSVSIFLHEYIFPAIPAPKMKRESYSIAIILSQPAHRIEKDS